MSYLCPACGGVYSHTEACPLNQAHPPAPTGEDATARIAALEDELANKSTSLRYTVGESEARRHRIAALEAELAEARKQAEVHSCEQLSKDLLLCAVCNKMLADMLEQARTEGERTGRAQTAHMLRGLAPKLRHLASVDAAIDECVLACDAFARTFRAAAAPGTEDRQ
jgi:hypothetical protein